MEETFRADIERAVGDEAIEAVVIGIFSWSGRHGEPIPLEKMGVPLEAEEALALLDYNYDTGYGAPDCHAVYVWTDSRVIFVSQYDGSTCIESVPRNPCTCEPTMPGS